VEQNVRALARDLQKPKRWTKALFSGDVEYQVGASAAPTWDAYLPSRLSQYGFNDLSRPCRASYALSRAGTGTSGTPSLLTTSATRKWCAQAASPSPDDALIDIGRSSRQKDSSMYHNICRGLADHSAASHGGQGNGSDRLAAAGGPRPHVRQVTILIRAARQHMQQCLPHDVKQEPEHAAVQSRILRVLDVDARIASRFTMNLLTGRVIQHRCGSVTAVGCNAPGPDIHLHWLASDLSSLWSSLYDLQLCTCRDRWDLSRSSIPAQAAVTALRAGWAARQKAADLSEDSSGLMDRLAPQDNGMDIQG
jgi:hypothetical protein